MKILILSVLFILGLGLTACSGKSVNSDNYYDRANTASEKSLKGLEKD